MAKEAPAEKSLEQSRILGVHPSPPQFFGLVYEARDATTQSKVLHRSISEKEGMRPRAVAGVRDMLVRHHVSPEARARDKAAREAMDRLGLGVQQARIRRFPISDKTRKGNLAEIVLAEYMIATSGLSLPVYRLRNNPNVDQSMKGDDVLAFDLDAEPVRIVIGEAKFRAVADGSAVQSIVGALVKSHKTGIPVSLQFVAERLFDSNHVELGNRVLQCVQLFAEGRLQFDYVGFLLSNEDSARHVDASTPNPIRRLAMISLGLADPNSLVAACFEGLE